MKTCITHACTIAFLSACPLVTVFGQLQPSIARNTRPAFAYPKGSWMMGVQGSRTPDNLLGRNTAIHLQGGYFVSDKLLLGLNATWRTKTADPVRLYSYMAGPQLRFQLTQTRVSPYIAASWQFGFKRDNGEQTTVVTVYNTTTTPPTTVTAVMTYRPVEGTKAIHSPMLGIGATIGIVPALRAEIAINWQKDFYYGARLFDSTPLQPHIGLNYVFLR